MTSAESVEVQTDWDVLGSAKDEVDEDWIEGGVESKDGRHRG